MVQIGSEAFLFRKILALFAKIYLIEKIANFSSELYFLQASTCKLYNKYL